jgi:dihydrofolate reductase
MKVSLIVAAADNRCIGINNRLPWHLPEDLRFFKRVTMGKPIIMGRKTFESIGKPLPGRTNIVISNNKNYSHEGTRVAGSLDEAIKIAETVALYDGKDEVMVIGGAGIYRLCLPIADRLYYTKVHASVNGDAFFPEVKWSEWKLLSQEDHKASGNNPYDYSFTLYERSMYDRNGS